MMETGKYILHNTKIFRRTKKSKNLFLEKPDSRETEKEVCFDFSAFIELLVWGLSRVDFGQLTSCKFWVCSSKNCARREDTVTNYRHIWLNTAKCG